MHVCVCVSSFLMCGGWWRWCGFACVHAHILCGCGGGVYIYACMCCGVRTVCVVWCVVVVCVVVVTCVYVCICVVKRWCVYVSMYVCENICVWRW